MILQNEPVAKEVTPLLLTVRETAKALAVCEKTIANLTNRGDLRPVRIGRAVRYDPAELRAFIERRKAG